MQYTSKQITLPLDILTLRCWSTLLSMHEIDTCFWSTWPWKNPPMGKTNLEQIYIEGLKAKCTTQETYTSEPGTIATTLGCLGVPWRPPHKPCEVRRHLTWWAFLLFVCFVFILILWFAFALACLWTCLVFVFFFEVASLSQENLLQVMVHMQKPNKGWILPSQAPSTSHELYLLSTSYNPPRMSHFLAWCTLLPRMLHHLKKFHLPP